jgi:F0F1-type ATP synthase membrane subunit b/b'
MKLFRRKDRTPSPEVRAAVEAAEKSARQARADLKEQEQKLAESRHTIESMRARNIANHYDEMVENYLRIE